ncbi:MAG TPA: hypothetical protein DCF73_16925 [Rhodobiaceae bacterium]|nr:hypothetical protein [Rhodobiaceae bacterium]
MRHPKAQLDKRLHGLPGQGNREATEFNGKTAQIRDLTQLESGTLRQEADCTEIVLLPAQI